MRARYQSQLWMRPERCLCSLRTIDANIVHLSQSSPMQPHSRLQLPVKNRGHTFFFPDPTQAADHRFLFSPPVSDCFPVLLHFWPSLKPSQPRGSSNLTLVIVLGFFRRCKTSPVIQGSCNTRASDSVLPPMSIHAAAFILFCLIFPSFECFCSESWFASPNFFFFFFFSPSSNPNLITPFLVRNAHFRFSRCAFDDPMQLFLHLFEENWFPFPSSVVAVHAAFPRARHPWKHRSNAMTRFRENPLL